MKPWVLITEVLFLTSSVAGGSEAIGTTWEFVRNTEIQVPFLTLVIICTLTKSPGD